MLNILSTGRYLLAAGGLLLATSTDYVSYVAPPGCLGNPNLRGTGLWSSTGGWAPDAERLLANGLNGQFYYQDPSNFSQRLVPGQRYRAAILLASYTSGAVRLVFNNVMLDVQVAEDGLSTFEFTAAGGDNTFNLQGLNNFTGSIEWVQISPI
jgi:hypothetical protein